jgi:hypothetical protein
MTENTSAPNIVEPTETNKEDPKPTIELARFLKTNKMKNAARNVLRQLGCGKHFWQRQRVRGGATKGAFGKQSSNHISQTSPDADNKNLGLV